MTDILIRNKMLCVLVVLFKIKFPLDFESKIPFSIYYLRKIYFVEILRNLE